MFLQGIRLRDVRDWNKNVTCVPTAVCAITGITPGEFQIFMAMYEQELGKPVHDELQKGYEAGIWMPFIERLKARIEPVQDFSTTPYEHRPTITEYMRGQLPRGVTLVFGYNPTLDKGHVFAADGTRIVDSYTGGVIREFSDDDVEESTDQFRVVRVFEVRDEQT